MRTLIPSQITLDEAYIANIKLDPKSRDDIPQLLTGLQHIYTNQELRTAVFDILQDLMPKSVMPGKDCIANKFKGRPGMEQWRIFVLGTLRLSLNTDYDRIHELANQHHTVRQMLGHGIIDDGKQYNLQTVKDNLQLFTPEILDRINQAVVHEGHRLLKKNDADISSRCDSFVVKTDVHFPTDTNLLYDSMRKTIEECAFLCEKNDLPGWRQSANNIKIFKKQYRFIQKLKHSTSKDETKQQEQREKIKKAHKAYIDQANALLERARATRELLSQQLVVVLVLFNALDKYIKHAERQIAQILTRVINDTPIPHEEKVFSIFEEHTEWISKGKAGVPVELGLRVCVIENNNGFILHHHVMQNETDDKVALSMIKETKLRFPGLSLCSFDKGFHTPQNQIDLKSELTTVVLPKKGKLSASDKERESSEEFVAARQKHSGIESAINALEVHGLDMCPDHGIYGFKRYVALAVVARNIMRLGSILKKIEGRKRGCYNKSEPEKLAA